jgi:glucose-6-phosphate 1-epimerase
MESSVVWNPWIKKAAALSDLDDEEWRDFVCIEQANAGRDSVRLPAGGTHTLEANYERRPVC